MRKLLLISLVLVSVVMVCSSASAARMKAYRGRTSAGTRIGFLIRVSDDGRMSMKGLTFKAELLCEDASTIDTGPHGASGASVNGSTDTGSRSTTCSSERRST